MPPIANTLPWLVPGSLIAMAIAVVVSAGLGRWLGVPRGLAWALVVAVGVILAATLSPIAEPGLPPGSPRACDASRTWLPSVEELLFGVDVMVNVLMFVPLGLLLGVAPWSTQKVLAILLAITLPLAIEWTQLVAEPLSRACQTADMVDNLAGLAIGLAIGSLVELVGAAFRRRRPQAGPGDPGPAA